jgi:hypothetical protein
MSNVKIAEELELNIEQVNKAIEKHTAVSKEPGINTATEPVNNLMITKTAGKGTNNIAIMTKEASAQHDDFKSKSTNKVSNNAIFRPKNNG